MWKHFGHYSSKNSHAIKYSNRTVIDNILGIYISLKTLPELPFQFSQMEYFPVSQKPVSKFLLVLHTSYGVGGYPYFSKPVLCKLLLPLPYFS